MQFRSPSPWPPHSPWHHWEAAAPSTVRLLFGPLGAAPWPGCGADSRGRSRHLSLLGALCSSLAARSVHPWGQQAPCCPVLLWTLALQLLLRGPRSLFSLSPGGQPPCPGSSQASGGVEPCSIHLPQELGVQSVGSDQWACRLPIIDPLCHLLTWQLRPASLPIS